MDLWRWAPVPTSDSPIPAGSSTSVNALSDRELLAVTSVSNYQSMITLSDARTVFSSEIC